MVAERGRKRLPPYISYRTFHNFLDKLQQQMPARIDRSYWGDMLSGSTGTQLMAALRFLDLIDEYGRPTDRLKPLASSNSKQRHDILREIAFTSFAFALDGDLDPQNATYSQLEEIFNEKYQMTGQLSRKCLKFFIELSNNAGITLSPFITKKFRAGYSSATPKLITKKSTGGTKVITRNTSVKYRRNNTIPNNSDDPPGVSSWDKLLLTKFPTFDPSWSDDVKLKWFTAFDDLMRRFINNKPDK